jgi:hypothetical protein
LREGKPIGNTDCAGIGYIMNSGDVRKFEANLTLNLMSKFKCDNKKEIVEKIYRDFVIN